MVKRGAILSAMILLIVTVCGRGLCAQTAPPGRVYSLEETQRQLGSRGERAEFRWDPFLQSGVFTVGGRYAAFAAGAPGETGMILLDGRDLLRAPAPYLDQGLLRFPEGFVASLKGAVDPASRDDTRFRIAAIVVDPGHGGKDPGAIGRPTINGKVTQVVEKEITLKMSRLLYTRLSSAYPDKRVLLTRQGDSYPSLEERVMLANSVPLRENEAIVYISIHANFNFNKNARGYEVWYLPPDYRRTVIDQEKYRDAAEVLPILNAMLEEEFTTESIIMARSILRHIDAAMGRLIPSRGLKAEEWYVVRNARMPAVLVELGFVSNDEDARILTNDTHLRNYAEALYKGIAEFITAFDRSGGLNVIQ
ncbi:MAG: N-acetylmuramoyl-L-alanine amidase [Treponema sp.]|jgi:N-acetylmuramoyl-L-alanine amidase|nr:N-acetylmuramoyl-L-alanine amidase [Treponema sp.]